MAIAATKKKAVKTAARAGRPRRFTHQQVVQAALDVMEREGFAALTMSSLAAQMKVSHSVLYKYVGDIQTLEGEALQSLAATLPVPQPGNARDLRRQLIDALLELRAVLLKHPGVLNPPIGSRAWSTFSESIVQWVQALTPHAASAEAAFLGHGALVATGARLVEAERVHGAAAALRLQKAHDKRLPPLRPLRDVLEQLTDSLFPGLQKSR